MHPIHTLSDRLKIHLGMPVAEFRAAWQSEGGSGHFTDEEWNSLSMAMEPRTIHDLDCEVSVMFREGVLARIEYALMEYNGSGWLPAAGSGEKI